MHGLLISAQVDDLEQSKRICNHRCPKVISCGVNIWLMKHTSWIQNHTKSTRRFSYIMLTATKFTRFVNSHTRKYQSFLADALSHLEMLMIRCVCYFVLVCVAFAVAFSLLFCAILFTCYFILLINTTTTVPVHHMYNLSTGNHPHRHYAVFASNINVKQKHTIYSVSQKRPTIFFVNNFAKCLPIFKILSPLDSAGNLQYHTCHVFTTP